jgi:hypothetical protein
MAKKSELLSTTELLIDIPSILLFLLNQYRKKPIISIIKINNYQTIAI